MPVITYKCTQCTHTGAATNMLYHFMARHLRKDEIPFWCKECSSHPNFIDYDAAKQHVAKAHEGRRVKHLMKGTQQDLPFDPVTKWLIPLTNPKALAEKLQNDPAMMAKVMAMLNEQTAETTPKGVMKSTTKPKTAPKSEVKRTNQPKSVVVKAAPTTAKRGRKATTNSRKRQKLSKELITTVEDSDDDTPLLPPQPVQGTSAPKSPRTSTPKLSPNPELLSSLGETPEYQIYHAEENTADNDDDVSTTSNSAAQTGQKPKSAQESTSELETVSDLETVHNQTAEPSLNQTQAISSTENNDEGDVSSSQQCNDADPIETSPPGKSSTEPVEESVTIVAIRPANDDAPTTSDANGSVPNEPVQQGDTPAAPSDKECQTDTKPASEKNTQECQTDTEPAPEKNTQECQTDTEPVPEKNTQACQADMSYQPEMVNMLSQVGSVMSSLMETNQTLVTAAQGLTAALATLQPLLQDNLRQHGETQKMLNNVGSTMQKLQKQIGSEAITARALVRSLNDHVDNIAPSREPPQFKSPVKPVIPTQWSDSRHGHMP